ncbi:glutathione S-transferase [Bordetella hinzii]|uniref:Glutathione S-transferase, C-terminal domain protein n=1 Tax=Bordetella hinzii OH87 BAL007II TaxID=1331262 RepID=A0ABR4R1E6_9BORD|nr:glutathione S-transferase [Bordetella hinzii]KCB24483.1 glutathione S-transferase, C-terminal domain protein [Bordetella hinzii OH87 BAL007II]KCB39412.1 glutathione S-transferase, C-terminal domain protein [Bordetella hinzii 5132]QDJ43442.1 glutathione S-transferase [Bordetella hinzii]QDJ48016.1 glutathione S-transferase [Bordetella hinzii]QDJ56902.1 glutathione S-transferase [Bordetella hinzii]
MSYELWYWSDIPGRGEFVRLALEAGHIPYRDCAREPEVGSKGLIEDMLRTRQHPPFAPPYLVADGMTLGQTANILYFLGERHGLAPADLAGRLWVNQLQLTIADAVAEAHDVHHPIAASLYYEDQQTEALRRAAYFRKERIPKYLAYFERALSGSDAWLAGGERWSYADLSLYHLVFGLLYAFPHRVAMIARDYPRVMALHDRVANLPELQAYLTSQRRLAMGADLFRHYAELDDGPSGDNLG